MLETGNVLAANEDSLRKPLLDLINRKAIEVHLGFFAFSS